VAPAASAETGMARIATITAALAQIVLSFTGKFHKQFNSNGILDFNSMSQALTISAVDMSLAAFGCPKLLVFKTDGTFYKGSR
jgi:hypothetical protein